MTSEDIEARRARDLERYHRRTAERRAKGLCLKCGKRPPAPHRSQCEPCAEKRRPADLARHHRRTAERADQGLCPKCGKRPPAPLAHTDGPCPAAPVAPLRAREPNDPSHRGPLRCSGPVGSHPQSKENVMHSIENIDTQQQSVTATICENAQLFGATPERGEFDPRDVWDRDDAMDAVSEAFRIIAEGVAPDGFQLADERESLLWGFVNTFDAQVRRLDRGVDRLAPELRDLQSAQDGTEVKSRELELVPVTMMMLMPKMDSSAENQTMRLGASLRDRATLSSPLRGLAPSGGYPSRLRSLRSLRAWPAARCAHRRVPGRHGRGHVRRHRSTAPPRPPRDGAVRRARRSPRLARPAGCAGRGHRLGLGRAALRASPVPASPRTGLRTRRALVPAQVRTLVPTLPPPPPAACFARLPAAPSATPPTQSPWRLPSAGFAGVDSPIALPRIPGCFYALRRVGLTPDASLMHGAQGCPCAVSHALRVDRSQLCAPMSCRKQ